jgi:copper(I)-binding protein
VSRSTKVTRGTAPVGAALFHSRSRIAVAALLAAGPLLTACSSGLQAQTSTERSVVDGEAAQAGDILIRYAHIDSPADPAHSQGGTALAYAAFYNGGSQPDALVSASADAATSVDVVPPSGAGVSGTGPSASPAAGTAGASTTGPATIPAGGSLLLMPDTGGHLALRGLTQPLFAGENVHLTLVFRNAGRCSFAAPVQVPSTPAPRPTPSKATE